MNIWDDITPYQDHEVHAVLNRIIQQDYFIIMIACYSFPRLSKIIPKYVCLGVRRYLQYKVRNVYSVNEFQRLQRPYIIKLLRKATTNITVTGLENLDPKKKYLFISNHRDIVMDPLLINYSLFSNGFATTHIAIGDNLLKNSVIADLMRLNKSFVVRRSVKGIKEKYNSLSALSSYINTCIVENKNSVWLSQREGRTKDGLDVTEIAVMKMLYIHSKKNMSFFDCIKQLHIIPVSISYEYDPCDESKAQELASKVKHGSYQKHDNEDIESIMQGLVGYNGCIAVSFGAQLTDTYTSGQNLADVLDKNIIKQHVLYPVNYLASCILHNGENSAECKKLKSKHPRPAQYLQNKKLNCSEDVYTMILRMYANILHQFEA